MEHQEEPLTCRVVALALHEAGLTPLPTKPGEQQPAIAWEELTGRPPTPDEIEAWYRDDPHRGVALLVGRSTLVVDVDPRRGGDATPFLGTTPVVQRTPAGGWQLFYSVTNGLTIRSRASALPGVELRARDAVVVLSPTRLAHGTYRWERGAFEALLRWDLPDYGRVAPVRELVERQGGPRPSTEWPQKGASWVAQELELAVTPVGSQEETLARMARVLAATGAPRDVATACLWSWAQRLEQDPDRPWERAVVSAMVDRVYTTAEKTPDVEVAGPEPSGTDESRGAHAREEALIARAKAACRSQQELSRTTTPDIEWAIPSFLAYEAVHDLCGGPRTGKSTLVSWWVSSLVTGESFAGNSVKPTGVVWLTDEPRATLDPLLRRAELHDSPDLHIMRYGDVRGVPWPLVVRAAVQAAEARQARILVVDSFARFAGCAGTGIRGTTEDDATHALGTMGTTGMSRGLDALRPALAQRMAVVIVRRSRKGNGSITDTVGEGSVVESGADVVYELAPARGRELDGARLLRATGRFGELMPELRTLTLEAGTGYRASAPCAEDDSASRIPPRWREIAALLPPLTTRENGEVQGITAEGLAKAARMSARSIRDMLKAVRAVEQSDGPLGQLAWVEASTGKRKVTYYGRPADGVPITAAACDQPRVQSSPEEASPANGADGPR